MLLIEYNFYFYHYFILPHNLTFNLVFAVTAVANGLQAWKILEDLTNHIDLVLTEVVMPFLSGIGLLCKIMSHKTFKNIPVISKYRSIVFIIMQGSFSYPSCGLDILNYHSDELICSDVIP